jgi:hypothetical protein
VLWQSIQAMVKAARADWLMGGHPNWAVWEVVSGDFLKQWHVPEDRQWAPALATDAKPEEDAERFKMRIASPPPWSAVTSGNPMSWFPKCTPFGYTFWVVALISFYVFVVCPHTWS